jgi:hypothetical protein
MSASAVATKLYCFVDETGQDTYGSRFLVAAVIVGTDKEEIEKFIRDCEEKSGRRRGQKWMKSSHRQRLAFIDLILESGLLAGSVYFQTYHETRDFDRLTVLTIIEALNLYAARMGLGEYKVTVIIDGLKTAQERSVAAHLRKAGVPVRAARGARDQSEALIRLADFVAGLLRSSQEGRSPAYAEAVEKALRRGLFLEI